MGTNSSRLSASAGAPLAEAAARTQSLADLSGLLRDLRRRHAREQQDSTLTYRELAERTGWSQAAIAEYFTARTLPPTDRFDALLKVLGATPAELRLLADARDRVEESRQQARSRRCARPAAASAGSGRAPGRAAPRQLPADTALFTGRQEELGYLLAVAERAEREVAPGAVVICAIGGMGGAGKTALAVHAGHRLAGHFPDGQLFLDLHGFAQDSAPRAPGDALAGLLGALGVPPAQIPAQVEARAALYRERLAGTRTLVVLDNAFDEAQVRPLLPAAAGSLVLITSRRRLKALDDAVPLQLDMLPLDQAVTLLRQAARAGAPPADDPGWERVADLCGRLPLALVIAGALLRTGGKAWTLTRLIDRLTPRRTGDELAGYTDEVRSLTAVFDLSYQALSEHERLLFRRLGLLPGLGIDAHGAAALLDVGLNAADALVERLADYNLLIGVSPGRYRVHDLVHAHASTLAARQDPDSERADAQGRLLHYYAHTAQSASLPIARWPRPGPAGPAPAHAPAVHCPDAARAWLRAERPDLDAAFAHASTHGLDLHAIELAAGLAEILRADGPWTHALEVQHTAAQIAGRQGRRAAHLTALIDLGQAREVSGDYPGSVDAFTRALELSRTLGDQHGEATAQAGLGRVHYITGDYPEAGDAQNRALELYRSLGSRHGEANALAELGRVRYINGDGPGCIDAITAALEIYRALGDRHGEATILTRLGYVRQLAGDYPGADDALTPALEIYRALGDRPGEATTLTGLGFVRQLAGDFSGADEVLTPALEIYLALGYRQGEAYVLNALGHLRQSTGDRLGAGDAHNRALELYRALGDRHGEATSLVGTGQVRSMNGDCPGSVDAFTRALEILRAIGDRGTEACALNYYAAALTAGGRHNQVLGLYEQALAVHRELNKPDDEAFSLEGIGEHYLATGDPAQGVEHLHQALAVYRRLSMRADIARVQARIDGLAAAAE
jgi:tetratricopeptide (TPR) repeat protein/transcriptional regulator with XRE-family HTH domain